MRVMMRQPDIILHEGDSKECIMNIIDKWEGQSKDKCRDYFHLCIIDDKGSTIYNSYGARYLLDKNTPSYDIDRHCYFKNEFINELYMLSRKSKTVTVSVEQIQTYTTTIRIPEEYSDRDINDYILTHPDFKKGIIPLEQMNVRITDNNLSRYNTQFDDDYENCIGL